MKKKIKKIIITSSAVIIGVGALVITAKISRSKGYDAGVFDVLSASLDNDRI